jgi:large subunit ribosomal protein L16
MLQPKKTKFRKYRKKSLKLNFKIQKKLDFGILHLKTLEARRINAIQLESSYRILIRKIKKTAKINICIFPNIPVTKKPREVRMGKGKGSLDH